MPVLTQRRNSCDLCLRPRADLAVDDTCSVLVQVGRLRWVSAGPRLAMQWLSDMFPSGADPSGVGS